MLSLLYFVLGTAIFVVFIHDFRRLVAKLFELPGVKLLLPLFIVTSLIFFNEPTVFWILLQMQIALLTGVSYLTDLIPLKEGAQRVAYVIALLFLTLLPEFIMDFWERKQVIKQFSNTRIVSVFIWIIASIFFVLSLY